MQHFMFPQVQHRKYLIPCTGNTSVLLHHTALQSTPSQVIASWDLFLYLLPVPTLLNSSSLHFTAYMQEINLQLLCLAYFTQEMLLL